MTGDGSIDVGIGREDVEIIREGSLGTLERRKVRDEVVEERRTENSALRNSKVDVLEWGSMTVVDDRLLSTLQERGQPPDNVVGKT